MTRKMSYKVHISEIKGQLVVYSALEVSEAVTKFAPSIRQVYLPENENFVTPEDINVARKINQTLKVHKL